MAEATAREVYMLELVNRARMDPVAEAARFGIDLNEGIEGGHEITATAKQPLAMNDLLIDAARAHSQWMLDVDVFSHTGEAGSSSHDRMVEAGYQFTGNWRSGENIAWKGTTGMPDLDAYVTEQHEGLFLSPGHRVNILQDEFTEVGIGVLAGGFTSGDAEYNSSMIAQEFAKSGTLNFLTGVVYGDQDSDDFYSIGEGVGGVTVTAVGVAGTYTTTTHAAGNYQMTLPTGTYTVTITGGDVVGDVSTTVVVSGENVRVAYDTLEGDLETPTGDLTAGGAGLSVNEVGGTAGFDSLSGTENSDIIYGLGGNDYINAGAGDDVIYGGAGNDRIVTGAGDDTVDGGDGIDTVVLSGQAPDYQISLVDGGTVTTVGEDGSDTFDNIERFRFDDQALGLDESSASIYRLYQAALGRTPDSDGLGFWIDAYDNGLAMSEMATQFLQSTEFVNNFGNNLSNDDFVAQLYHNILGRAGEADGTIFWQGVLDDGTTRETVLLGFTDSSENLSITQTATANGVWFTL